MDSSISIDLLRHGQTTAGNSFIGSTDVSLNTTGWKQMLAAPLRDQYDVVIASPLLRCLHFAEKRASQNNEKLLIEEKLKEIHFGEWEGRSSEGLWETDETALINFWKDPVQHTPPGAENLLQFRDRVMSAFIAICDREKSSNVLLVCHAGVIKVILTQLLGMDLNNMQQFSIDHGSVTRIEIWPHQARILFVNKT